jgi:16S rRNA (cytosine1402-N4)-methyltransferase
MSDIFFYYGEERKSRLIARKICNYRQREKINTTQELVRIITNCFSQKKKKHPARKVFQALRIAVNQELNNLSAVLGKAAEFLKENGRIIVISYHSLEDRIVKEAFKKYSENERFKIFTKKPLIPTSEEMIVNHQARSAKMRILIYEGEKR